MQLECLRFGYVIVYTMLDNKEAEGRISAKYSGFCISLNALSATTIDPMSPRSKSTTVDALQQQVESCLLFLWTVLCCCGPSRPILGFRVLGFRV